MGLVYVDAVVKHRGKSVKVRLLVDSGATYTVLTESVWRPEYDLLLKTLRALEHVVLTIGRSKSRGLGWFRLAKDKSQLLLIDLNKATKPQELIEMLTNPEQYAERIGI